ncbi:phage terminase large subunit family protein [Francisella philomiragia]|uniref:phage terminase large subunit family protein n=1 Tax=Francisella philomiragia TaxID=28110 RepID=UPI002243210B|nr:terminase gpA endonuclease subunit [Francisella philomiragia]
MNQYQAKILVNKLEFLRPPKKITLTDWAEKNIKLSSKQSAKAGSFKAYGYQQAILDEFTNPYTQKITMMMAAQLSKSLIINIMGGYCIYHDPKSFVVLHATMSDKNKWLHGKFQPMIEDNPHIKKRLVKPRSDDGTNTAEMKDFLGGAMYLAWSGSEASLRSISVPVVICDEVDAYEMTKEGCAVNLISQRSKTFEDQAKMVLASTPTVKGISTIEKHYLESNQCKYYIPCPHCKHEQVLSFYQIKWHTDETGKHYPNTAKYECIKCKKNITHQQKRKIILENKGRWIAKYPDRKEKGFHLSELYAPFSTWEQLVEKFLKAKRTNDLQSFKNTVLAETWEETGETLQWHILYDRCEVYEDDMPATACFITAGVDIQKDRLEMEVVAWGIGETSWSLDYHIIYGDVTQPEIWQKLTQKINKKYHHPNGYNVPISRVAIDTGAFTQDVYSYIAKQPRGKVIAIKGQGGYKVPLVKKPVKVVVGNRSIELYSIGVDEAKTTIYNRLNISNDRTAGYCHFSEHCNGEIYFKQLTSEKKVVRYKKGYLAFEWVVTAEDRRNEALDCRVYSYFAMKVKDAKLENRMKQLVKKC